MSSAEMHKENTGMKCGHRKLMYEPSLLQQYWKSALSYRQLCDKTSGHVGLSD